MISNELTGTTAYAIGSTEKASKMMYSLLADAVMVVHMGFVVFAVLGALLVIRWRWVIFLHLPAALWAVLIEWFGWECPLTPIENWLRLQAGGSVLDGGFIQHYLGTLLYPGELGVGARVALGLMVLVINGAIYVWIFGKTGDSDKSVG